MGVEFVMTSWRIFLSKKVGEKLKLISLELFQTCSTSSDDSLLVKMG